MKDLSRLLLAPTIAAALLLACTPTNAARRGGGSAYDGTWWTSLEVLVCCYAALGKWDEARRCAQQMASVTKQPGDVLAPLKARNPAWAEQMTSALRRATA